MQKVALAMGSAPRGLAVTARISETSPRAAAWDQAMANFATHIGVGTIVSGGLATVTLAADVITPEDLMVVTLAGLVGSVLPDIDSKESRASRAVFSGLAFFFAFCIMMMTAPHLSIAELWLLVPVVFLGLRYGLEAVFHSFSYHRGIWHSIAAGLFFWFATALAVTGIMDRHPAVAWLAGAFLFAGYLTHLILDEIFSVDLLDRRLKLSFGSALKLIDGKRPAESALVLAAAAILFVLAPPSSDFTNGLASKQVWSKINQRFLPENNWFRIPGGPASIVGRQPPATTGSISKAPSAEHQTETARD